MNKKVGIIAAIAVVGLLGGYALIGNKDGKNITSKNEVVMVEDAFGEKEVPKNPETIVSFDYGIVDALDSLGVEVDGLPKGNGNLPEVISKYKDEKYVDLGSLKEPNFETVNALKPDLIIISGRQAEMQKMFENIAPTIYLNVDGNEYIKDFTRNMTTLGKIFDKEEKVASVISDLNEEMETIKSKVTAENLNALTLMVNEGSISAFSEDSRFGMIYGQLGFKNVDPSIETSDHGQQVTFEYVSQQNPDYIFIIDRGDATGGNGTAKTLFDNDLIKSTDAYKNGNIIYLNSQVWYTVAGGVDSTKLMIEDIKSAME